MAVRGRPPVDEDKKVSENGLFALQWERIQADALKHGVSAAAMLRHVVKVYYSNFDLEIERNSGLAQSAPEVLAEIEQAESAPVPPGWVQDVLPTIKST